MLKQMTIKKTSGRILALLLAIALGMTTVYVQPLQASAAETIDSGDCGEDGSEVMWKIDKDGTLTISGKGSMSSTSGYNRYKWGNSEISIKKIVVEDGVTSIARSAFDDCSTLTEVSMPESITRIGSCAFQDCEALTNIDIPNSVTSIGTYSFENCKSITDIVIPNGVANIEDWTFHGCTALTNITIPDSVTNIGKHAFRDCISLTDVSIPDSVTSIGTDAFMNCKSLTNVTLSNNLTILADGVFGGCTALGSIVIPDGVTKINSVAFNFCTALTSITIPDSITDISSLGNGLEKTVLMVKKSSYAYDWVLKDYHHYYFKVIDSPIVITFDSNGGSPVAPIYDVVGNSDSSSDLELPKPLKEGWYFKGWQDGNGEYYGEYELSEGVYEPTKKRITESVTLYAQWRQHSYEHGEDGDGEEEYCTVKFNSAGGSSIETVTNIPIGSTIEKPKDPVKKGYIFAGWFNGSEKFDFSDEIYKDITLKAKWKKNKAKIEKCSSVDIGYTYKLKLSSNAPVKKVTWTSSNKKILKVIKKKKDSVTVEGLKNKKKATLKAVVTFQDGSRQTVRQTIRVKKEVKHKNASKSKWKRIGYPKGIRVFDKETPAINRGRDADGVYEYLSVYDWKSNVLSYVDYLRRKGYKHKTNYYDGPNRLVLVYIKGNIRCRIYVRPLTGGDAIVNIEWDKKIKK